MKNNLITISKFASVGLILSMIATFLVSIFLPPVWTTVFAAFMGLFGAILIPCMFRLMDSFANQETQGSADSDIVRSHQTIDLTLELVKVCANGEIVKEDSPDEIKKSATSAIKISGIHKYTVQNNSNTPLSVPLNMFSALGRGKNSEVGFEYAKIGNKTIDKEHIQLYTQRNGDGTLRNIVHNTSIPANEAMKFEFHSYGIYRLSDRIVWIIQTLSDDLVVTAKNNTHFAKRLGYQIIHPHYEKIERDDGIVRANNTLTIDFGNSRILPYQGFEVSWDFE